MALIVAPLYLHKRALRSHYKIAKLFVAAGPCFRLSAFVVKYMVDLLHKASVGKNIFQARLILWL